MSPIRYICLVGAALCLGAPGLAVPAPDAARIAAAEKLLDAMHFNEMSDRTIEATIAESQKTFPQRLEQQLKQPLPAELRDKLFAIIASSIRRSMAENRVQIRRGVALMYASRFTAAELKHVTDIQKDPVMVKMQQAMPQIAAESIALATAAMAGEVPRMTQEIEAAVKEYFATKGAKPST